MSLSPQASGFDPVRPGSSTEVCRVQTAGTEPIGWGEGSEDRTGKVYDRSMIRLGYKWGIGSRDRSIVLLCLSLTSLT